MLTRQITLGLLGKLFLGAVCLWGSYSTEAQTSVLADGIILKIGVVQTGVHKISGEFLTKIGIDLASIQPQNIQLFGSDIGVLPQANTEPSSMLSENAIWVQGGADGRFNTEDYLLFFGQNPHRVFTDGNNLFHQINPYSDTTYYFLKFSNSQGLRVASVPSIASSNILNTFSDYAFHEADIRNMVRSGREWYGEVLNSVQNSQIITFEQKGRIMSDSLILRLSVIGASGSSFTIQPSINAQNTEVLYIPAISQGRYDEKGVDIRQSYSLKNITDENLSIKLTLDNTPNAVAYINFLAVQSTRKMALYNSQTLMRLPQTQNLPDATLQIEQASQAKIWNVTNGLVPENQLYSTNVGKVSFGFFSNFKPTTFVVFSENNLPEPVAATIIENQNLQNSATPNLLIICPKSWQDQAQRLATYRQHNDKLSVQIVSPEAICNEFGSGSPDPTAIRNFVRMLWRNAPDQLRYLLLFADASFDFKNKNGINSPTLIPTYESRESLNPLFAYSSDDYFGFLKSTDGEWYEGYGGDQTLDIGVGRLPAKNHQEAKAMVNKLLNYAQNKGDWQQKIAFVADDGDYNIHLNDADYLAENIAKNYINFDEKKIFLDAMPQISMATGQQSPATNSAINNVLNDGLLLLNYTGHGGEAGWAEEQILTTRDILRQNNKIQPLFITATCEFGRFDDPAVVSGAELTLLNPQGGAIGLLTTTRPVFANTNFLLNNAFYQRVFEPTNGAMPRLGDIFKDTKNNSLSGRINRNFSLLGDPSLQLAYPEYDIFMTSTDTLKALASVKIQGEIRSKFTKIKQADFNGMATITVFDKVKQTVTQGTESVVTGFNEQSDRLFRGQAVVKNGSFELTFTMPKDIRYNYGKGKILAYALADTPVTKTAIGANATVIVGGSVKQMLIDSQPPTIALFLDTFDFKNGDEASAMPTLLANIQDDTGINIASSGIGHELVAILDQQQQLILNNYYTAVDADGRAGTLRYTLPRLSEGKHTLSLKVYDLQNNATEAYLIFFVKSNTAKLTSIVYPNPFSEVVNLSFTHDFVNDDVTLVFDIFDSQGNTVHHAEQQVYNFYSPYEDLRWNGYLDFGQKMPLGTYFYRIFARSQSTGLSASTTGKLVFAK